MIVFVSSPFSASTTDGKARNAQFASKLCKWVTDHYPNQVPIAPHMICSQWWNDEDDRDKAINYCKHLLCKCEILYVYSGVPPTEGMVAEIKLATLLDIPIVYINDNMISGVITPDLKLVPFTIEVSKEF